MSKLKPVPRMFLPSRPISRLVDRQLQTVHRERVFRADVDEAVLGADRVRADRHRLDDRARIAFHDGAVHERTRVAFIGVADDVLLVGLDARRDLPLETGGEARTAAAADAGVQDFLNDFGRCHLREGLRKTLVARVRDVVLDGLGVDQAAVAERDTLLLRVERHLRVVVDLRLERGLHIEEALDDLVADDVLLDNLLRVLGRHLHVEHVVGHHLDDRALGAEAEAARLDDLDVGLEAGGLDLIAEVRHERLGGGGVAARTAAAEDILLPGVDRALGDEAEGQLALRGLERGVEIGLARDLVHFKAQPFALNSLMISTAFAGVTLPYTWSLTIMTGARPQAPTQRRALTEKRPSAVGCVSA